VATTAYVRGHAFGSGAVVALATAEVWMSPGSSIGAASPTEQSMARVKELDPDGTVARAIDSARELLQGLVRRRARSDRAAVRLAGAMADARLNLFDVVFVGEDGRQTRDVLTREELEELDREGREVVLRTEFSSRPLTLDAETAARYGLSRGTTASLEEVLREELGVQRDEIRRMDVTWSEQAAGILEALQSVLFVLGFLLLVVELKTPGFAVPGALGVLLLSFALFGSYLSGLADITEFVLLGAGLALLAVEIFVVPGTLIAGALGLVFVGSALVLAQQSFLIPGNAAQMAIFNGNLINLLLLVVFVIAGAVGLAYVLPNTPIVNRAFLEPVRGRTGQAFPELGGLNTGGGGTVVHGGEALIGRRGEAMTLLRPAGIVVIDGERYDARSAGQYIDAGAAIEVLEVRGTGLVVAEAEGADDRADDRSGDAPPGGGSSGTLGDQSGEVVSLGLLLFLLALGLVFIVLEVFFVSLGALSILAALSIVSSVFLAFTNYGQVVGLAFLGFSAVAAPAVFFGSMRILPYTPFGKALFLDRPPREKTWAKAQDPRISTLVDATGEAVSDLRPAGFARIGGKRVDVVTRGEMISSGTPVRVVRVDGNRVVVRADS
jgi:membrane-bound serine protease (ClpP class)